MEFEEVAIVKDMNYYNTFIEVAEDCPAQAAEIPPSKGGAKTAPVLQYEMISDHPYKYTQEDVLFEIYALRNQVPEAVRDEARDAFFSKGQPCLRTSMLGKRYGWGIHFDEQGRAALYSVESDEYRKLANEKTLKHYKAMRSKKK